MWNFFDVTRDAGVKLLHNPAEAPEAVGYYLLFGITGNFVYVGKGNLRERLSFHFSERETNILIKLIARYFFFEVTPNEEDATVAEGQIYDRWVRATGENPLCNDIRPPKANVTDNEMLQAKLRIAFGLQPSAK